jgi:rhodanese-related sulfurtransferase
MKNLFPLVLLILLVSCSTPETNETSETSEIKNETAVTQLKEESQPAIRFINVDPATFAAKMASNPGTLLDVRTPEEIAEGKISGSMAINYNDENFAESLSELDPNKPVYVYCAAGGRSSKTATILGEKGFQLVYNLDGGITAWQEAGMPTTKE